MKLNEIVQQGKSVADLGIEYTGGDFHCDTNKLTSLEGAPKEVGGNFNCNNNQLTSLKGAPKEVGGFFCITNQITSLEHSPHIVKNHFIIGNLPALLSLNGVPREVGGDFYCYNNKNLKSIDNISEKINGDVMLDQNPSLTNFKDVHKYVKKINGDFSFEDCPVNSHVLGLLLIEGITEFKCGNKLLKEILNGAIAEYPNEPKKRVLYAQKRLLEEHSNGKELAKL